MTIGFVKNGLVTPDAGRRIGRLACAEIGIVPDRPENKICSETEWNDRYADRENYYLSPAHPDMAPIHVASFEPEWRR